MSDKKKSIVIISALVLIGVVFLVVMNLLKQKGTTVIVRIDGTEQGQYQLDQDQVVDIIAGEGAKNKLRIENGQAQMIEADCPDQICVNHSSISHVGESIICLPHKVVVEIAAGADSADTMGGIDGIAN